MNVSFHKIKTLVREYKEARYGHYVDLETLLEHLAEENEAMDKEETVLRFLYELSKNR